MTVNDTVRLDVVGTSGGQEHIHTLHFRLLDPTATEQGLIDDWQANGRTTYRLMFSVNDAIVQLLRASQVCGALPLRAPVEEAEAAGSQVGTSTKSGDRLPTWCAALISWRTAFAGKSRRGRSYIGGLFESDGDGNNLVAGTQTVVGNYMNAIMGRYGPAGTSNLYRLVVYSQKLASVPGTQCQDSSTVITSGLVRVAIASMKSRKPGSGN